MDWLNEHRLIRPHSLDHPELEFPGRFDLDPDVGPGCAGTSRWLGTGRAMWPGAVHELDRALVADRAVGSFFVVVSTPSLAFSPGVVEGQEPGDVQAFCPDLAVEGLGEGIVRWLARPTDPKGGA